MKALKLINNRLRWVSLGVYLTLIFIAWLENDDNKKKKTTWNRIPSSPGTEAYEPNNQFNNYKHNHQKEEIK